MPVLVVDASALGALLFAEPRAEEIIEMVGEATLTAPALLGFELASICLKKIKRHRKQAQKILTALNLVDQMTVEIVEVDHPEVVKLAKEAGLTTYDTSYLWLAKHLNVPLITLDVKLRRAAADY